VIAEKLTEVITNARPGIKIDNIGIQVSIRQLILYAIGDMFMENMDPEVNKAYKIFINYDNNVLEADFAKLNTSYVISFA
jgi:hypothetical protein